MMPSQPASSLWTARWGASCSSSLRSRTTAARTWRTARTTSAATRPDLIAAIHKQYLDAGAADHRDQLLQRPPAVHGRVPVAGRDEEINHAAARIAREAADEYWTLARAAIRGRVDGSHDAIDHCHAQRDFRGAARRLLRAGQGVDRRRSRHSAARDLPGHPQREGRAAGDRASRAGTGLRDSGDGVGHDRADGHDARRTNGGRVLRVDRASQSAVGRPELRDRSGVHDGPHPHPA